MGNYAERWGIEDQDLRFWATDNMHHPDVTGQCVSCFRYGDARQWIPNDHNIRQVRCPSCGYVGVAVPILAYDSVVDDYFDNSDDALNGRR